MSDDDRFDHNFDDYFSNIGEGTGAATWIVLSTIVAIAGVIVFVVL